jgi:hypothetical protein
VALHARASRKVQAPGTLLGLGFRVWVQGSGLRR